MILSCGGGGVVVNSSAKSEEQASISEKQSKKADINQDRYNRVLFIIR